MQWSERPPASRSHFSRLARFRFGPSAALVAVAHFILVRCFFPHSDVEHSGSCFPLYWRCGIALGLPWHCLLRIFHRFLAWHSKSDSSVRGFRRRLQQFPIPALGLGRWHRPGCLRSASHALNTSHLTNHWSEPLAALSRHFDDMRNFPMYARLAPASGRSVHSR